LVIVCDRCHRRCGYGLTRLLATYGPESRLPDLRWVLAGEACQAQQQGAGSAGCGAAYYPKLVGGAEDAAAGKPWPPRTRASTSCTHAWRSLPRDALNVAVDKNIGRNDDRGSAPIP
jgi:hypothetical protein